MNSARQYVSKQYTASVFWLFLHKGPYSPYGIQSMHHEHFSKAVLD